MKADARNKLVMILVGLLIAAMAVQSVVLAKLYQRSEAPETKPEAEEPIQMDLQPKAKAKGGPPASGGSASVVPQVPALPFGVFGFDPDTWDPFQEFQSIREQMEQMFSNSYGRFRQSPDFQSLWGGTTFSPNMDVEEKDENYIIRMNIPGTDKSNISVDIKDRQLTVSGEVDETVEQQGKNQLRKERRSGQFSRTFTLPGPVEADEMEAKYERGVLIITVPKAAVKGKSRRIEVK